MAYRCHSPQCIWVMIFSTKDGGAASRIRNGDWMQDQTLKDDLSRKVRQNWKKSEILESKYPLYAWRKRTLACRLQYFAIKFTNYEVDIEDAKWDLYHTSSTKCKSRSSKVWTVKNTHRLSAWYDKNLARFWECCLFVCLFWGSLQFMKQLIGIRGLTMLHFFGQEHVFSNL